MKKIEKDNTPLDLSSPEKLRDHFFGGDNPRLFAYILNAHTAILRDHMRTLGHFPTDEDYSDILKEVSLSVDQLTGAIARHMMYCDGKGTECRLVFCTHHDSFLEDSGENKYTGVVMCFATGQVRFYFNGHLHNPSAFAIFDPDLDKAECYIHGNHIEWNFFATKIDDINDCHDRTDTDTEYAEALDELWPEKTTLELMTEFLVENQHFA